MSFFDTVSRSHGGAKKYIGGWIGSSAELGQVAEGRH
jgi:hypothetical protein